MMNFAAKAVAALLACLVSAGVGLPTSRVAAAAEDAASQPHARFLTAAALLAAGRTEQFQRQREALEGYVLAPYLDYAALRRELRGLDHARAQRFLDREAGRQLALQFRREWLNELARRQDWSGYLRFDDADVATSTRHVCQRLQAGIASGTAGAKARAQMVEVWGTGQSLPDACDPAIAHARAQGWIDNDAIWLRLRLAVEAGNDGLARHLARQLPEGQRSSGERLAQAVGDPAATLRAAAAWPDSASHREAASLALRRRARQQVDDAIAHWPAIDGRMNFDPAQRTAIVRELALYAAVAYRDDAGDWFERVPEPARDEQLLDWRLRVALARLDWREVLDLSLARTDGGTPEARHRYWHARALDETGQGTAAHLIYQTLAGEATFHGFLAADRIGAPYALCPLDVAPDPAELAALQAEPDLQRALELHAVEWRTEAVRAWEHALRDASLDRRLHALHLADQRGWYDRAVFNLRNGDELRHYALRFPVAKRDLVEREAASNGLDPAWVYALIRAESAWQPHARSHANAYGLMQLVPATGQRMARELQIAWNGSSTLLDAGHNVRLGTRYLSQQAERFGASPWLASAAYNAGPSPVERWLQQRASLPADVFIETIPYHETRAYVPRILAFSVIYDWRLHGKARPLSSRLPDPGQRYAGVPALGQARTFVCPLPTVASTVPST